MVARIVRSVNFFYISRKAIERCKTFMCRNLKEILLENGNNVNVIIIRVITGEVGRVDRVKPEGLRPEGSTPTEGVSL
jgi:hypothetical protein